VNNEQTTNSNIKMSFGNVRRSRGGSSLSHWEFPRPLWASELQVEQDERLRLRLQHEALPERGGRRAHLKPIAISIVFILMIILIIMSLGLMCKIL